MRCKICNISVQAVMSLLQSANRKWYTVYQTT